MFEIGEDGMVDYVQRTRPRPDPQRLLLDAPRRTG
jgi:hypothetical protein